MGLIQRSIESEGIASISISLSIDITSKVRPPRALYFGFPLGQPIPYPNQASRQLRVLRLLLKYLKDITSPGTLVKFDMDDSDGDAIT